jgi:hypothetical protein
MKQARQSMLYRFAYGTMLKEISAFGASVAIFPILDDGES